jgi:transcriptional regulator with XRE-family HTH domain
MMVTPYVGRKIKEIRAKKRIPQKAILEKTGLKQSYLANVETGRIKLPLLANLRKIADALGVSIEALVEGQPASNY